jgi:hypothetical protein
LEEKGAYGPVRQKQIASERHEVESRYDARRDWINEGMRTVKDPYLRVVAVLVPKELEDGA